MDAGCPRKYLELQEITGRRRVLINEELRDLQQINQNKEFIEVRYAASKTNRRTAYTVLVWKLKLTNCVVRNDLDGRAML